VSPPGPDCRPRLGPGLRLQFEQMQGCHVLLYPEGMVKLNGSAGEIMQRCDGKRTLGEIVAELEAVFSARNLTADVLGFVDMAGGRRWLQWE
jgi:pyrroloquinoline quinone biosynthesis protein D